MESTKERKDCVLASEIIEKYKKNILNTVSSWTGEKKYVINILLGTISNRCRELRLVSVYSETTAILDISVYIATLTMNYLYTGRFRGKKWRKS